MANPRVKISGEQTVTQAANEASQGLDGLKDAANSAIEAAKGFVAYEVLKQVAEWAGECDKAFAEMEESQSKLTAAMASSAFSDATIAQLQKYTQELTELTGIKKEDLIVQEAWLVAQGKTAPQIEAIINAAEELATHGFGTLDSNVQQLAKSYEGVLPRQLKMIEGMQGLTKAQLEAGDAVKLVSQHFQDQIAGTDTTEASINRLNNAFHDFMVEIGQDVEQIIRPFRDMLTGLFKDLTSNGQAAKGAIDVVLGVVVAIIAAVNPIAGIIAGIIAMVVALEMEAGSWNLLWLDTKRVFLEVLKGIADGLSAIVNVFVDDLNSLLGIVNSAISKLPFGAMKPIKLIDKADAADAWGINDALKSINTEIDKAKKGLPKKGGATVSAPGGADASAASSGSDSLATDIGDAFSRNYIALAAAYQKTQIAYYDPHASEYSPTARLTGGAASGQHADDPLFVHVTGGATEGQHEGEADFTYLMKPLTDLEIGISSLKDTMKQSFSQTEIGKATGAGGGDPIGLLTQLGNVLGPLLTSFSSIQAILNPIQTIMRAMFQTIEPIINSVLQPLDGILVIIGQTLGAILIPVIQCLTPIITIVSQGFIDLYNYAIVPLADGLIWVGNAIYDGIVGAINAIANGINAAFGWLGVHMDTMSYKSLTSGFLSTINMNDLNQAGSQVTGTGSSSANASYQQAQPVNITMTIQGNLFADTAGVTFDQLALMMQASLKRQNVLNMGTA